MIIFMLWHPTLKSTRRASADNVQRLLNRQEHHLLKLSSPNNKPIERSHSRTLSNIQDLLRSIFTETLRLFNTFVLSGRGTGRGVNISKIGASVCVSWEDTSCKQAGAGSERWGEGGRTAVRHGGAAPSQARGTTQQDNKLPLSLPRFSLAIPASLHLPLSAADSGNRNMKSSIGVFIFWVHRG